MKNPICYLLPLLFSALLAGCAHSGPKADSANQLTSAERKAGWEPLFDGQSLETWRRYGKSEKPGPSWVVEDGWLRLQAGGLGGDIITKEQFSDFELQWEWRIRRGGNNGLKYLVSEARPGSPGPEYQMIDDSLESADKRKTASLYDVLPPTDTSATHHAGDWNYSRLLVRGKQVEHWLNGKKVLAYELESPELKAAIAQSKFKNVADFDQKLTGHIMLTDHKDETFYRNVKIKRLAPKR